MPGPIFGLHEVALLGHETKASLDLFKKMFDDSSRIPVFKNMVSQHPKRVHYRAGNKHVGILKSAKNVFTAKTPYDAVCADILEGKSRGTFAHVADFSFLINADHPVIRASEPGGLAFFATGISPYSDAGDAITCRLLVEEHVFAFTWTPVVTRLFSSMMMVIAAAKLGASAASAASTLGGSVGSLIDSIRDAAAAVNDVIKLGGAVSAAADQVAAIKDIAVEVLEGAQDVSENYSAFKGQPSEDAVDVREFGMAGKNIRDLAEQPAPLISDRKSGFLGIGQRVKTDREKRVELGAKNSQTQKQLQSVFFMTVQQITPVLHVKSDMKSVPETRSIEFNSELYIAKRSYLRVGETPRDKFSQMAAIVKTDSFAKSGVAAKVCFPWFPGNEFTRFVRTRKGIDSLEADPSGKTFNWNYNDANDWSFADSKRSSMSMSIEEIALLDQAEKLRKEREIETARMEQERALEAARQREQSQRLIHQGRFSKVLAGIPGKLQEFSARREARIQAEREAWLRAREEQQKKLHVPLMTEIRTSPKAFQIQMRAREKAEKLAAEAQNAQRLEREREARINALIASIPHKLPTVEKFKASTTIKTGFILNRRTNPKLLRIDSSLATVLSMFKDRKTAASWNYQNQVKANLLTVILACDDYLGSKLLSDKAAAGHVSVRLAPVKELKIKVAMLYAGMD